MNSNRRIDVQEAARLYLGGMTAKEVGQRYGVSRQAVHAAIEHVIDGRLRTIRCRICNKFIDRVKKRRGRSTCAICKPNIGTKLCACGKRIDKSVTRCYACNGVLHRKYSHEDAAYLYRYGFGTVAISIFYGVTHRAVYHALIRMGIKTRGRGQHSPKHGDHAEMERVLDNHYMQMGICP